MINNLRTFQEVLKRNNLPTPDTYLGISELIRSLYRPDVSPNPERIREVLEELTWPVTVPAGNPITFKSCSEVLASEALVTFSPKQSGTGDPSPSNIRPISGWDSLHLYQDTEQTETPETTHSATFPSTIYGGSHEFVSGKLVNARVEIKLKDLTWKLNQHETLGDYFYASISGVKYEGNFAQTLYNAMCNKYAISKRIATYFTNNHFTFDGSVDNVAQIQIRDSRYSTAEDFANSLANDDIVIGLAVTPQEITLTPTDVNLLKGSNTVWTDGDTVQIKFQILK